MLTAFNNNSEDDNNNEENKCNCKNRGTSM